MSLWVDTRWHGNHGIARFSREVVSRLTLPFQELDGGSPASVRDVVNPARLRLPKDDLVFSPGWNSGPSRARQILTLHDLMHLGSEGSRAKVAYYDLLLRKIIRRSGTVLTVSGTSQLQIAEWLADEAVDVVNVGNGISDHFRLERPDSNRASETTILYVGNLKAHKRFDIVLDVVRRMKDVRLRVISGDGAAAVQRLEGMGLVDRASVASDISDAGLAEEYRRADVLLMPSMEEGFGLPAAESVACGTPVVHWQGCAAVAEIVGGYGVGVTDLEDTQEWIDALREIIARGRLPETEELRAWRAAYDWSSVAARVQVVLERGA